MTHSLDEAPESTLRELCDQGKPLACRWCAKCDHHYRFCKCEEPEWKLRSDGKLGPLPGQPGGPITMAQYLAGQKP